jgi:DNA-binding CsgD family transcriptional regulator
MTTSDGAGFDVHDVDGDTEPFASNVARYFAELSKAETQAALAPRTLVQEELYAPCRRERLALYYDYLVPRGVRTYALRVWMDDARLHLYALQRTSLQTWPQFQERALPQLDAAFLVVAVAEKLQRTRASSNNADISRDLTLEYGLTAAEHKSVELLVRGLTNPEIAAVLGVAPNTVRNQLAASYVKLGVSRRSEVAFILTSAQRSLRIVPPDAAVAWFQGMLASATRDLQRRKHRSSDIYTRAEADLLSRSG